MTETLTHTIDAEGKSLGRVASQAAILLRGKGRTDFAPHKQPKVKVKIINAGKVNVTAKKAGQTVYKRYTGYPGGFYDETMAGVAAKKGYREVLRQAIERMMPRTKLRPGIMKNLTISE